MGGSSQAQYPAAMLGDLWQNQLGSFAYEKAGAQQGFYNAWNDIAGQVQPFGTAVGQQAQAYIPQALAQGFDPQQALYNQKFQQQLDQSQAVNAQSGVAGTPYGAALTQQGNQNFDIAWQAQQLANQAQGAQTASNLSAMGLNALNAPIQDYMNYIAQSNAGAANMWGAVNQSFQGANQMYGSEVTSQNAANQQAAAGKSGLGQLAGGVMGLLTP